MPPKPSPSRSHYLAKSEPLPRYENGHDVSFPLSTLASSPTQRTHWEGVRNAVAGRTLKGMHVGDRVLFYHSNCKLPGVAGEVEVCGEPVPDECAFDPGHPYYDKRSKREEPRWYMVSATTTNRLYAASSRAHTSSFTPLHAQPEVRYISTFPHFVPLALLQHLVSPSCPDALDYLTKEQVQAIREMDLLKKGRLSVQNVSGVAYEAVVRMGEKGGWEAWRGKWNAGGAGGGKGGEKEDGEKTVEAKPKPTAAKADTQQKDGQTNKRKAKEEANGQQDIKAEEPPTTRRRSARNSRA